MKTNYFFGIVFLGLLSAATVVAMDCPVNDGERLPGSARERACFLAKQLRNGSYEQSQKPVLDRTFQELEAQGHKKTYGMLVRAERDNLRGNRIIEVYHALKRLQKEEQVNKRKRNAREDQDRMHRDKRKRTE